MPPCSSMFHFDGRCAAGHRGQLRISVSMVEKYVRQAMSHCQKQLDELHDDTRETGGFAP